PNMNLMQHSTPCSHPKLSASERSRPPAARDPKTARLNFFSPSSLVLGLSLESPVSVSENASRLAADGVLGDADRVERAALAGAIRQAAAGRFCEPGMRARSGEPRRLRAFFKMKNGPLGANRPPRINYSTRAATQLDNE